MGMELRRLTDEWGEKWRKMEDREEMGREVIDKVLTERDSWAMEEIEKWIKGVEEREKEESVREGDERERRRWG